MTKSQGLILSKRPTSRSHFLAPGWCEKILLRFQNHVITHSSRFTVRKYPCIYTTYETEITSLNNALKYIDTVRFIYLGVLQKLPGAELRRYNTTTFSGHFSLSTVIQNNISPFYSKNEQRLLKRSTDHHRPEFFIKLKLSRCSMQAPRETGSIANTHFRPLH